MANNIKIVVGNNANLSSYEVGNKQILLSKDTKNIYFDDNGTRYNITNKLVEGIYINEILKLPISELYGLEEYVTNRINELIDGAGEAYDTLKELSEYIKTNIDTITALQAYTEDLVDGKIAWIYLSDDGGLLISNEMELFMTTEENEDGTTYNAFLQV